MTNRRQALPVSDSRGRRDRVGFPTLPRVIYLLFPFRSVFASPCNLGSGFAFAGFGAGSAFTSRRSRSLLAL